MKSDIILTEIFWNFLEDKLLEVYSSRINEKLSLSAFLDQPRSKCSVITNFNWNPDACERYLHSLVGFGYLNYANGKYSKTNKLGPIVSRIDVKCLQWFKDCSKLEIESLRKFAPDACPEQIKRYFLSRAVEPEVRQLLESCESKSFSILAYDVFVVSQFLSLEVILAGLETGLTQIKRALNLDSDQIFDHYSTNPYLLKIYSLAFFAINDRSNKFAVGQFQIGPECTVLDVGGGAGALAKGILDVQPTTQITIYEHLDSEIVFRNLLDESATVKPNIKYIYGDFFDTANQPFGGFAKLPLADRFNFITFGWILHDWDDDKCVQLLRNAVFHLERDGSIFILEKVIGEDDRSCGNAIDFLMLLMANGKERTRNEYRTIAEKAGLDFYQVHLNPDRGRDLICLRRKFEIGLN